MRIRYVKLEVDFRKSEETNWAEYRQANPHAKLGPDDIAVFVSKRENLIRFILGTKVAVDGRGTEREVLDSRTLRIKNGSWDACLLADYAKEKGINLDNAALFERQLGKLRASAVSVTRTDRKR